jgi:hypothetical protein
MVLKNNWVILKCFFWPNIKKIQKYNEMTTVFLKVKNLKLILRSFLIFSIIFIFIIIILVAQYHFGM